MAILVHMPGDGVRRAHLVVVALTGSAPGVHDRVVVANHSPAVQHVIDCCGTIHDLEDLPLHNDHGVEKSTAVGSTCTNAHGKKQNRRHASCCHRWSQQIRTSPAHLPGRLPASLRSCHPGKIPVVRKRTKKYTLPSSIRGVVVHARRGVHVVDLVGLADLHVALALRLRRPGQLTLGKKEPKTT